jgi:Ku70/Ku80 C-terminal arm.
MSHFKFYLILMVFVLISAEDIRTMNIESTVKADAEQISNARAVVKKLRFPYTPYMFDNPKLQVHWRNIEALVLDYDERPEAKDDTGNMSSIFHDLFIGSFRFCLLIMYKIYLL